MAISPNAAGSIYLIAVLLMPTEKERIEGAKKLIVVEPTFILADDPAAASNKAIMLIDKALDPDRCEVLVTKPF